MENALYSQTSFTIYDRSYISCLKVIFKQGKLLQLRVELENNVNAMEYATRRGILLVGNCVLKLHL